MRENLRYVLWRSGTKRSPKGGNSLLLLSEVRLREPMRPFFRSQLARAMRAMIPAMLSCSLLLVSVEVCWVRPDQDDR